MRPGVVLQKQNPGAGLVPLPFKARGPGAAFVADLAGVADVTGVAHVASGRR